MKLSIKRKLVVDGLVSANGQDVLTTSAGGGSGGSIWINTDQLQGSGTIQVSDFKER